MLLAITADLHLPAGRVGRPARDDRELGVLGTWREALGLATEAGASAMVVAGDVFDTPYPSPWQVGDFAASARFGAKFPAYLMAGNHDVADEGRHALMAYPYSRESVGINGAGAGEVWYIGLGKYPLAAGACDVLSVPYAPHSALGGDWLRDRLDSMRFQARAGGIPERILISHLGIAADDSPAYMRQGRDVIAASELLAIQRRYEIHAAFLGNWHGERDFLGDPEHRAYQIGALCPTGFDNPGPQGSYGRILLYDTVTREVRALRARHPTYQTLDAEEGVALLTERILIAQSPEGDDFDATPPHAIDHYRVRVRSEEERAAVLAIAAAIEKIGLIAPLVRVAPVWAAEIAEEARDRSTSAAEVVRSAGALTLEQRIERYVAAKGVREGIDPAQVVEIACAHARGRA
jgi:hypothetical protein